MAAEADTTDGISFTFRLVGDIGKLAVTNQRFFGWLHLERLELEVPNIPLPVDMSAGPGGFKRRRTELRVASMRIEQRDIDRYTAEANRPTFQQGSIEVDQLQLICCDGFLRLSARIRQHHHVAETTARIYLSGHALTLRLLVDDVRVYGFVPTPAPLLIHQILSGLLRADAANTSPHGLRATSRGLGDVELTPLAAFLWKALPRAGWRLPSTAKAELVSARSTRGSLQLNYGPSSEDTQLSSDTAHIRRLHEAMARCSDADQALLAGNREEAVRGYRTALVKAGGDDMFAASRLLSVAACDTSLFTDAVELARQLLGRWPDYPPAHLALASVAIAEQQPTEAATRFRLVSGIAEAERDDEAAARAALMSGRLLRSTEPTESTAMYELVLRQHPGHAEATEALADRYSDEGRWHDLTRLIRQRISRTKNHIRQARDHLRLAHLFRERLGDTIAARKELQQACKIDPDFTQAFETLATIYLESSERTQAIEALDGAAATYRRKGDHGGEAAIHVRVATELLQNNAPDAAQTRLQQALDLAPNNLAALRVSAQLAERRGDIDAAIGHWEKVVANSNAQSASHASHWLELGRCLVLSGNDEQAIAAFEHATHGPFEVAEPAVTALADILSRAGKREAELKRLTQAIALIEHATPGDASTHTQHRLAELAFRSGSVLLELKRPDEARPALERAYDVAAATHPTVAHAAACSLIALSSANHDRARWIEAALSTWAGEKPPPDVLIKRAELASTHPALPADASEDIAQVLANANATPSQRRRALELQAELCHQAGDWSYEATALARLIDLTEAESEVALHECRAAEAWLKAGKPQQAFEAANRALGRVSDDTVVHRALVALGDAAWRARQWPDVIEAYQKLAPVADNERRGTLHYRIGVAFDRTGAPARAAEAVVVAAESEHVAAETRAQSWFLLADLYDRLNDPARAASAMETFAQTSDSPIADSVRCDAWHRAGELFRRAGNHTDAERCFQEALRVVSEHLPALDALEALNRDDQNWERVAVILGRKVAVTAPHPARQKALLVRLGQLQRDRLHRTDVARQAFLRALNVDPDYRQALVELARMHHDRGDVVAAAEMYARLSGALTNDTNLEHNTLEQARAGAAQACFTLAEQHREIVPIALTSLRAALTLDPANRGLADMLRAAVELETATQTSSTTDETERPTTLDTHGTTEAAEPAEETAETPAVTPSPATRRTSRSTKQMFVANAPQTRAKRDDASTPGEPTPSSSPTVEAIEPENPSPTKRTTKEMFAAPLATPAASADALAPTSPATSTPPDDGLDEFESSEEDADAADAADMRKSIADYHAARSQGDVTTARLALDRCGVIDSEAPVLLGARADFAAWQGDYEAAATWLQRQASATTDSTERAETLISLSDLLYDHVQDPYRARAALREAADAFGPGPRQANTLRMLGAEASAQNFHREATEAYKAIPTDLKSRADFVNLASCYQRIHMEHRAVTTLEAAEASQALDEDGAALLFALRRERSRRQLIAESITRVSPAVSIEVRRRYFKKALDLYETSLEDNERAVIVKRQLATLECHKPNTTDDEKRSEVDALLQAHSAEPQNEDVIAKLDTELRAMGDYERLADCYVSHLKSLTGSVRSRPLALLGNLCLFVLDEPDKAYGHLRAAYDLAPETPLAWLGLADSELARGNLAEARDLYRLAIPKLDEEVRAHVISWLGPIDAPTAEQQPQADDLVRLLRHGQALADSGEHEAAIAHYEQAHAIEPHDQRPLRALAKLYRDIDNPEGLTEILGRLIVATDDPKRCARLWYRRAKLYRNVLHREPETYHCLKEAYAHDPNDADIAHSLRSIAITRGEWGLTAELLYREIEQAPNAREQGALHLELAMIYDEKLLDAQQAQRNYEQALALDKQIPAAPRPLARLYELKNRHEDAARLYEQAAQLARTPDDRAVLQQRAALNFERAGAVNDAKRVYTAITNDAHQPTAQQQAREAVLRLDSALTADDAESILQLQLEQADTDEARVDAVRNLLDYATTTGDPDKIHHWAQELFNADHTDSAAFQVLKARASENENFPALATLLDTRAAAVDPEESAALYYELGLVYVDQIHDHNAAMGAFELALGAQPEHPGALENLARLAYEGSDWARAHALYRRLRPETCSLAEDVLELQRGQIAEALGREVEALAAFSRSVANNPHNRAALQALVRSARRAGDLKTALSAMEKQTDLLPPDDIQTSIAHRLDIALVAQELGHLDRAIECYESVLLDAPKSTRALLELKAIYVHQGNVVGAARAFRGLLSQASSAEARAELLYELGILYADVAADNELADDAFLKAIDLAPQHAPTQRRLVTCYWRMHNPRGVVEMASALHEQGKLFGTSEAKLLGRVLIAALLTDDTDFTEIVAGKITAIQPEPIAEALREAATWGGHTTAEALSKAATAIDSLALGFDSTTVGDLLAQQGEPNEATRALIRTLRHD